MPVRYGHGERIVSCWLWDPAQGRFTAGPAVRLRVEPDPMPASLRQQPRRWGTYDTDIYVPDEHGALVHGEKYSPEADPTAAGTDF